MRVITGGRQVGKTSELIKMSAEAEAEGKVTYIVCSTQAEAYRIAQAAKLMDLTIAFPITYGEFLNRNYAGQNIDAFYIDNLHYLIQQLTYVPIKAVTIET